MRKKINLLLTAAVAAGFLALVPSASAQTMGEPASKSLIHALGYLCIFAAVGTFALIAGFKVFDKVITRIDFEEEIKKGNVAAGILAGAVVIGLSIIIAVSMM